MKMRCIAIDDEPLALKQLAGYIEKSPYLTLTASCQSAVEAQRIMATADVDVIFIDINMPDMSGLDFVRSLGADAPMVVFTTAYSEYALEGYRVDAVDYLLKPFDQADFSRAVVKLKKRYESTHATPEVSQLDEDDAIFLKTDYKVVRVDIKSITHIEAMSEYLRIYVEGQPKPIIVLLSMKKMEERLPSQRFMRIHRSSIINLTKIKEVARSHVTLVNDVSLPIGDMYKEAFNAYLSSKFLTK